MAHPANSYKKGNRGGVSVLKQEMNFETIDQQNGTVPVTPTRNTS